MGTVSGDCGSSTLTAAKLANDVVAIYTGYTVYLPVSQRFWGVYANGLWSGFTYPFTNTSTGPSWYANVAGTAVGGGWAGVTAGSSGDHGQRRLVRFGTSHRMVRVIQPRYLIPFMGDGHRGR